MITIRRGATAAATALLLLTAGCSSDGTVPGRDGGPFTAPSTATPRTTASATTASPTTSSVPSSTGAPTTASAPTTADAPSTATGPGTVAAGGRTLCATSSADDAVVQCLRTALSDFWSGQLNEVVSEPVYLTAAASTVPKECRSGLDAAPAFTCRSNKSLYINQSLLDIIDRHIASQDRFYAFASIQSHEIGHVLQYTLRQPQIESGDSSDANSRFLEQQADCLSGVWAAHATGGFDKQQFRRVAVQLVTLVSSNPEVETHGTPALRAAAIDRGMASGRPQSCMLTTFG